MGFCKDALVCNVGGWGIAKRCPRGWIHWGTTSLCPSHPLQLCQPSCLPILHWWSLLSMSGVKDLREAFPRRIA